MYRVAQILSQKCGLWRITEVIALSFRQETSSGLKADGGIYTHASDGRYVAWY